MMNIPTISGKAFTVEVIDVDDSLHTSFISKRYNSKGKLHSYSRRIRSEVCMDKECRPLDIILYWNVTGRYLGFELPEGEFLSKTDHIEFKETDYQRLHSLLEDAHSPLGAYSLKELVPDETIEYVDGVTSATNVNVKDYIVDGAVFTTHVLWNLVHGDTNEKIQELTNAELNVDLLTEILSGENEDDVIWGLDNIPGDLEWTDDFKSRLIHLSSNKSYTIAEKAMDVFDTEILSDLSVQSLLFEGFDNGGYLTKRKILKSFEKASALNPEIKRSLIDNLHLYNASLVKNVLELLAVHRPESSDDEVAIASLMNHHNRFIAKKAFQFFEGSQPGNKKVEKIIKKYKSR